MKSNGCRLSNFDQCDVSLVENLTDFNFENLWPDS
uniref:Uncharacterized protein n=1 Tax=Arundo donax TaxID=35708 RepID=A0A0A8XV18_ARUDO